MERRYSCYSWLYTKIRCSSALRKGPGYSVQMAMTFVMKAKIIECRFLIDCICHVASICHVKFMGVQRVVWGWPHECAATYWDSREQDFNLSVLPLVFSILGMRHEAASLKSVHFLHDRKAVTSELHLLPFFPSRAVISSAIFTVKSVPMCLVADTRSPKAWTTLWMVTTCIMCTERVSASTITPNASYCQCLQGAPNEVLMEKWLMT